MPIRIPGVPYTFPLEGLLARHPVPLPREVLAPLWEYVCGLCAKLRDYRPRLVRVLSAARGGPGAASWLPALLGKETWAELSRDATLVHLRLKPGSAREGQVRIAIASQGPSARPPRWQALESPSSVRPLTAHLAWELDLPGPASSSIRITAWDVAVTEADRNVLGTVEGEILGVIANAVMVANAPTVRDGRLVAVEGTVPVPVRLLYEDLVGPRVVQVARGQPESGAAVLAALPLGVVERDEGGSIESWAGLHLDATAGLLMINAPDHGGRLERIRRGTTLNLRWYRRTDGSAGNVAPGEICIAEASDTGDPWLVGVSNPLGTTGGVDREPVELAMERLLSPSVAVPVLPADFERLIRHALGTLAEGWLIRCWTWTERSLGPAVWWPPEEGGRPPELDAAGPDTLVVAMGPHEGALSPAAFAEAERQVQQVVREMADRMPVIARALIYPLHALTLRTREEEIPLPTFQTGQGELVDARGRSSQLPPGRLLLNAAITRLEAPLGAASPGWENR